MRESMTPASPIDNRSSASFFEMAPMSTHKSVIFDAFSRSSVLDQMDRLLPHNAEDISLPSREPDSLGDQHLRIPPANRRDVRKALVIDVGHDDADLVDVTCEHDRGRPPLLTSAMLLPATSPRHLGEMFGFFAPDLRRRGLEARGSGRIEQLVEEGRLNLAEIDRLSLFGSVAQRCEMEASEYSTPGFATASLTTASRDST